MHASALNTTAATDAPVIRQAEERADAHVVEAPDLRAVHGQQPCGARMVMMRAHPDESQAPTWKGAQGVRRPARRRTVVVVALRPVGMASFEGFSVIRLLPSCWSIKADECRHGMEPVSSRFGGDRIDPTWKSVYVPASVRPFSTPPQVLVLRLDNEGMNKGRRQMVQTGMHMTYTPHRTDVLRGLEAPHVRHGQTRDLDVDAPDLAAAVLQLDVAHLKQAREEGGRRPPS